MNPNMLQELENLLKFFRDRRDETKYQESIEQKWKQDMAKVGEPVTDKFHYNGGLSDAYDTASVALESILDYYSKEGN